VILDGGRRAIGARRDGRGRGRRGPCGRGPRLPAQRRELRCSTATVGSLRFTNGSGENDYVFGVPNDPLLLGATVYFQDAVFDPAGAFESTLALSNGVRLQVGS
jgi:hypothetical protein